MIGVLSVASLLLREGVRLARVAFGASAVQQSSWRELAREISHALRLTRHVRLIRNPNASVLGTWGTLHPRVLLPRESESWSRERMRVVLGHELAHVKRNDWLIQIIAETARAIYWFNPLFWIACMQLRRESEHACDDAAMNLGGQLGMDGPTYAGHVLDLARTLKHSGQPASAALAMASTSNLERRLIAMLNPSLNRSITGKGTAVIVAVTCSRSDAAACRREFAGSHTDGICRLGLSSSLHQYRLRQSLQPPQRRLLCSGRFHEQLLQSQLQAQLPLPKRYRRPRRKIRGERFPARSPIQSGAVIPGVRVNMTAQSTGLIRQT